MKLSRYIPDVFWAGSIAAQLQSLPYYWRSDLPHSIDWQQTAILLAIWALLAELRVGKVA